MVPVWLWHDDVNVRGGSVSTSLDLAAGGALAADTPVIQNSPAVALSVAGGAIVVLLILIMGLKLQPVVALLLVSLASALLLGVPVGDVMDTLYDGIGETLAEVALLVALGAMLGRMLEVSGGASVLAEAMVRRFGERRAPFALGVGALLFGIPIFLDVGIIIFLPIVFSVAKQIGGSVLRYGLPVAGSFAVMHAFVPPHPGPVAAAGMVGADIGLLLLIGLVVAIPTWLVAALAFGSVIGRRVHLPIPEMSLSTGNDGGAGNAGGAGGEDGSEEGGDTRPSMTTVLSMLLLPVVLILLNTGLSTLSEAGVLGEDSDVVQALMLVGESPIALTISVLLASLVLGKARGMSGKDIEKNLTGALGPIAAVILVTGAGGMFGAVLETGGVGQALAGTLQDIGVPLILAAFLIAVVMRVAQGSATVAITTAGGFIAPAVQAAGDISPAQVCLLVIAIAAGGTVLSHVNDSGFWLVSRLFGMDVSTTLRTWTVQETLIGVVGFLIACGLWTVL
ncbi:GntP family permease [Bounagaea algeriensis]